MWYGLLIVDSFQSMCAWWWLQQADAIEIFKHFAALCHKWNMSIIFAIITTHSLLSSSSLMPLHNNMPLIWSLSWIGLNFSSFIVNPQMCWLVHICTDICTYMSMYLYIYVHICTHIYIYEHICSYMYRRLFYLDSAFFRMHSMFILLCT